MNKNSLFGLVLVTSLGFASVSEAANIAVQCVGRGHTTNGASVAQMNAVLTGSQVTDGQVVVQGEANMLLVRGGRFNIPLGKIKIAGTYSKTNAPAKMDAFHLLSPEQPKMTAISVNVLVPTDSYVIFDDELFWMACQVRQ